MPGKSRKPRRPLARHRYRSTSIPGLMLHPVALLLNVLVLSAEGNAKTNGPIPLETVNKVAALIRRAYDLPDFDRAQGKGVVITFIGQFFHPDDYVEHRIANAHADGLREALESDLPLQALPAPELRTTNAADPAFLAQEREGVLPVYYKQRFLSLCLAGESAELDKLRGEAPPELLEWILGTIWHDLGLSDKAHVYAYPSFVPARRVRKVSVQNALEWAKQMKQFMDDLAERGEDAELTVIGPPGPSYTVRSKKRGEFQSR